MTDDLRRDLFGDTGRDQGLDAPLESDDPTASAGREALRTDDAGSAASDDLEADQEEENPLLRQGAGALDAADIDDPDHML